MGMYDPLTDPIANAAQAGRISAVVLACDLDLRACAADHPDLFPPKPFGPKVFAGIAMANAFGSPEATVDQLRMATRSSLWFFALDFIIDKKARRWTEVNDVVTGCLAVAGGRSPAPGDSLQSLLAGLRDELFTVARLPYMRAVWTEELKRTLEAQRLEWEWKAAMKIAGDQASPPTLDEYLANADNFGSCWVNVAHWTYTGFTGSPADLEELREASRAVQRVLRLLNDDATIGRDRSWGEGDLNALMLGLDHGQLTEHIARHTDMCKKAIDSLRTRCPEQARYLERQIGYSKGFYAGADYWGELE
jgi:hypothetical protein